VTYDGHLVSRFRVLCGSTSVAVAVVAFAWSFQHVVMPLTFDSKFMVFLLLSSVPHSVFATTSICDFAGWFRSPLRTP
jgi:hypothetical protein